MCSLTRRALMRALVLATAALVVLPALAVGSAPTADAVGPARSAAPSVSSAAGLGGVSARSSQPGSCREIAVLVVDRRGAGWSDRARSIAPQVRAFARSVQRRAGRAGSSVRLRHLGLQMPSVERLVPDRNRGRRAVKQVTRARVRAWFSGGGQAVWKVRRELRDMAAACPDQAFVLAGFAQGASVVHRTLVHFDDARGMHPRIVGALLVSDGDRARNTRATVWGEPPAPLGGRGAITRKWRATDDVPGSGLDVPVFSVCNKGDIVCDLRGWSVRRSLAAHRDYGRLGARKHTFRAANRLNRRAQAWPRPVDGTVVTTAPGEQVSQQLAVRVGGSYRDSVVFENVSGMPSGLSLSPSGVLTGSVDRPRSWTVSYTVRNTSPQTTATRGTFRVVSVGTGDPAALDAGGQVSCRVTGEGDAACAGQNTWGQVGVGDTRDVLREEQIGPDGAWTSIETSGGHTCGVRADADLYCWGMNMNAQLGLGKSPQRWNPQKVRGRGWTEVSTGWMNTCGIKRNRTLWCWGNNSYGQVGRGNTSIRRVPGKVGDARDWASVSVGGWHVCATKTTGALYCWGRNDLGQLGTGDTARALRPRQVATSAQFRSVDAGWSSTCGLTAGGEIRCWGLNDMGQLGDGTRTDRRTPTLVAGGREWKAMTLGDAHACGLDTSGTIRCWGSNRYGQLGTGLPQDSAVPVPVAGGRTYAGVVAGWMHTCGMALNGAMQCWGSNEQGQLGTGDRADRSVPPGATPPSVRAPVARPDGRLKVTSFNVLGSQHTSPGRPGGGARTYAPGRIRSEWTGNLLTNKKADIVGFQELQYDQYRDVKATLRDKYSFYPERVAGNGRLIWQSVMWRTSEWKLVAAKEVVIPFLSRPRPNPMVRLRNRNTGKDIWVLNVHNVSKQTEERRRKRAEAVRIEVDAIQAERDKDIPVIFLGDMNERRPVFCTVTGQTDLRAVNGGSRTPNSCRLPRPAHIDWIFASPEFTDPRGRYQRTPMTNRISDHPVLTGRYRFNGA